MVYRAIQYVDKLGPRKRFYGISHAIVSPKTDEARDRIATEDCFSLRVKVPAESLMVQV